MAKPRLLMLTQRVPYPADRGDRIRALNLLRFLSCRADISLACAAQDAVPSTSREALQQYCREFAYGAIPGWKSALQDIGSLAVGRSASEAHFYSADLMKTVRAWAKKHPFDGIVCYCSSMYSYLHCEELKRTPVIVDLVDVDSRKWLDCAGVSHRPVSGREMGRLGAAAERAQECMSNSARSRADRGTEREWGKRRRPSRTSLGDMHTTRRTVRTHSLRLARRLHPA